MSIPNLEILTQIAALLGISVTALLAGVFLAVVYPRAKLFLSDILRLFAWAGTWVRRASVQAEIEGAINTFARGFNSQSFGPLLDECKLEWVTEGNCESIFTNDTTIVRVSFSDNHDRNFFNAVSTFVSGSLLRSAKPFIDRSLRCAIDLVSTRDILRQSRRSALSLFNDDFRELAASVKDDFFLLDEIEKQGLFGRVLVEELHFFGASLGESAPRQEHETEARRFAQWLNTLVTREQHERSTLLFQGATVQVGVILVASDDTYEAYGLEPYIRRARGYAYDEISSIYLLSRGLKRAAITKQLARALEETGYFQQFTRRPDIEITTKGKRQSVTCIGLRPDLVGIVQSAWDTLEAAAGQQSTVRVTVRQCTPSHVVVDAFGLRIEIPLERLSGLKLTNATKYFVPGGELEVRVLTIDRAANLIDLSNVDTPSDPKALVDALSIGEGEAITATVSRHASTSGYEHSMFLRRPDAMFEYFVPRRYATHSRFVALSERYPVGASVNLVPVEFSTEHATVTCRVADLLDPWDSSGRYIVGRNYSVTIRELSEYRVTCELEEGVEGTVGIDEISWGSRADNVAAIDQLHIGEKRAARILEVRPDFRRAWLSFKRTEETEAQKLRSTLGDRPAQVKVRNVTERAAIVGFENSDVTGILTRKDACWQYCNDLRDLVKHGQVLTCKVIDYDAARDQLKISLRDLMDNGYEAARARLRVGDHVFGRIDAVAATGAYVSVSLDPDELVPAFVHVAELSRLAFVREKEGVSKALPPGTVAKFCVKRFNDEHRVLDLSRKEALAQGARTADYGVTYRVRPIGERSGRHIVQCDLFEAILLDELPRTAEGAVELKVMLAARGDDRIPAEVTLA